MHMPIFESGPGYVCLRDLGRNVVKKRFGRVFANRAAYFVQPFANS